MVVVEWKEKGTNKIQQVFHCNAYCCLPNDFSISQFFSIPQVTDKSLPLFKAFQRKSIGNSFHLLVSESQKKIEKISSDYKNGKRGYFPKVPFQCEQSKWWEHNSRIGTNVSDRSIGYPKIDGPTKEEILFEKGYVSRRLYKLTNFPMK